MSNRGVRRRTVLTAVATTPLLAGCNQLNSGETAEEPTDNENDNETDGNELVIAENETRNATDRPESEPGSSSQTPSGATNETQIPQNQTRPPQNTTSEPANETTDGSPTATNSSEDEPSQEIDEPTETAPPSGGGGGGGGGSTPDPEPDPDPEPEPGTLSADEDGYETDGIKEYSAIVWHNGGKLVIDNGSGFILTDTSES